MPVILEIVFGILSLLQVLAYVFWDVVKLYKDEQTAFQWFMVFQFSILSIYLIARTQVDRANVESKFNTAIDSLGVVQRSITNNTITLRENEFYVEFRRDISTATSSVDITHLDTLSPLYAALPKTEMKRYYDSFVRIVKSRPTVRFRRVERLSIEKGSWLRRMVADFEDEKNFSLACLITSDVSRKVPQISVQLIDGRKCYLVAVKEHFDAHGPRDICISDPAAVGLWLEYYNQNLWGKSLVLLDSGKLNTENWEAIQARLGE